MDTRTLGDRGEAQAKEFLLNKGYLFLDQNFSWASGEIDLIFIDGEFLVFVEVKLRKNKDFGYPRDFVNESKQRKILMTAEYYMEINDLYDLQPRFDVVEIIQNEKTIDHIENAFP